MDSLRGKYRVPYSGFDMDVGSHSAVLSHAFVAESLRREEHKADGLGAARGAVNAVLISAALWIALGVLIFTVF